MGDFMGKIDMLPDLHEDILNAIDDERLILFIGAGFSRLCGLPSWYDLAKKLMDRIVEEGCISFGDKELILQANPDSKRIISIAKAYMIENDKKNIFFDTVREVLTLDESNREDVYNMLLDFVKSTKSFTLTTNADLILDDCYSEKSSIYFDNDSIQEWKSPNEQKLALVHIHGSIHKNESMVFTTSDYLNRYKNPDFNSYLSNIFDGDNTILFIGYGLSEFEILDYMILKANDNIISNKWYVLEGYYEYQDIIVEANNKYYESLGITQIPYSLEEKGYNQLAFLLDAWRNQILEVTNKYSKTLKRTKEILNNKPTNDLVDEFHILCGDSVEENPNYSVMFKYLVTSEYSREWIMKLYNSKYSYFSTMNIVEPIKVKDGYRGVSWIAFDAFEAIYNSPKKDLKLQKIAIELASNIYDYLELNPLLVDNFYFIHSFNRFVFSDKEIIDSIDIKSYFELVSQSKFYRFDSLIYVICDNVLVINQIDFDKQLILFKEVTNHIILNKKDTDYVYEFELFFKAFSANLVKNNSLEVFNFTYNIIKLLVKENPYTFAEMGALYLYPEESKTISQTLKRILVKWLKLTIPYLSRDSVESIFFNTNKSKELFDSKLSIYLLNIRFSILGDQMLNIENQFDNWFKYSDLCILIENNIDSFDETLVKKLFEWVAKSDFGKESKYSILISANKYDALRLLNRYKGNEKLSDDIENTLRTIYSTEFAKIPPFQNRNRLVTVTTSWESTSSELLEQFNGLTFPEVCQILIDLNVGSNFDMYTYQNTFKEYLTKNTQYIEQYPEVLTSLPSIYFSDIISVVSKDELTFSDELILYVFNELSTIVIETNSHPGVLKSICWAMERKKIYNTKPNEVYDLCNKILDFSLEIECDINKYLGQHPFTYLINNDIFVSFEVAFKSTSYLKNSLGDSFLKKIKDTYDEIKGDQLAIFKACISSFLDIIYQKDSRWIDSVFDDIFDNALNHLHLSYVAFSSRIGNCKWAYSKFGSLESSNQFVNQLQKSSGEIEDLILNFSLWLIFEIYEIEEVSALAEKVITNATPELVYNFFKSMANSYEYGTENQNEKVIKKVLFTVDKFIELHMSTTLLKRSYDQSIRYLMNFLSKADIDNNKYLEYAKYLAYGFTSYFSEEITSFSSKLDNLTSAVLFADFIYIIIKECEDYVFTSTSEFDDIESIIKQLRFLKVDKRKVNAIINELGKRNHKYFELL